MKIGLKSRWLFLLLAVVLLASCEGLSSEPRIVATVAPSSGSSTGGLNSDIADNSDIAAVMTLGSEVWSTNCARCHGDMGGGTAEGAPLPDLTNVSDEQILGAITDGFRSVDGKEMPAFGETLSPDQLNAAMTFAKMMSRAIQTGMVQSGADQSGASSAAQSAPPSIGAITGVLTNGTADGTIPTAQTLTLHVVDASANDQTQDAVSNADGSYRFDNVPFNADYQYAITTQYHDVTFVSDVVSVNPAQPELALPIAIYEGGADVSAIVIDGITAQVSVQDNVLEMIQIVSFANMSDRVFYASDNATNGGSVGVHVPQGASLAGSVNTNYQLNADSSEVFETRPILPGQSRIMHLTFQMPYTTTANITQVIDYPLSGNVDVILASGGLTLTSDSLPSQGPVNFSGMTMQSYGETLQQPAGSTFSFRIDGSPVNASSTTTTAQAASANPVAYFLIGAGVMALVLAAILTIRDRIMQNRKGLNA